MLYPLKFKDIYKEKVWGGRRLSSLLGKDTSPIADCGEAWVLSGLPGDASEVSNGYLAGNSLNELVEIYMDDLVGETAYERYGEEFPLLFKFIDAHDWLSVQVHPDDILARERGMARGKTELWYVIHAEPGAQLISGFNQALTEKVYLDHLAMGKLKDILNFTEVKKGDVFFMPPGRVHALGPGIVIAEVQQAADITYRIYDWDRPDKDGQMRELHTELAMKALDLSGLGEERLHYHTVLNQTMPLSSNDHFRCGLLHLTQSLHKDLRYADVCVVYLCLGGQATLAWEEGSEEIRAGEAVLVPAMMDSISLRPHGSASFLEVSP
ncbi:MAG TPA: class I mannose-6-phosphate isomerase [Bacteroidales bacterium]|nr:class I mannose-6-phosphate isomerase [Bacteroidales bacterium]HRZ76793.1 class I mannose-6-phosphate isomerase [Bacteroidales bacterium]